MRHLGLTLLVALVTGLSATASGNLIVNGSFEIPGGTGSPVLEPGSTFLEGWVVTRGSIDYIGGAWPGLHGSRSIDLDGTPGFGGVTQSFATIPGATYSVTFLMSGNPYHYDPAEPKLKLMRVTAATSFADFSYLTDIDNNSWVPHEWGFVATSAQTTIEFYSLDTVEAGYSGFFGPALDHVVVTLVPEPLPPLLLGMGLVMLGMAGSRRRSCLPEGGLGGDA